MEITRRDFVKSAAAVGAGCLIGSGILTAETPVEAAPASGYHKGMWFKPLGNGAVQCTLCPLNETLQSGRTGACRVRVAANGAIYVAAYNRPAAMHLDPLEKNPVYHFKPGQKALALATAGCNLACPACQNWEMSQRGPGEIKSYKLTPAEAVFYAKKNGCKAVTFTFTEPVVFMEYLVDIAAKAKEAGLSTHAVTGGYVNTEPLKYMCKYIDSFSMSIKGEDDASYGGRPGAFKVIKNAMQTVKSEGKWLEVAVLVTPTVNDSDSFIGNLAKWVNSNLGSMTPVHFSRFYPSYKLKNIPETPVATLERAHKSAQAAGLKYVYVGNVPGHNLNNTFCHSCRKLLIQRVGFRVLKNHLRGGTCSFCGTRIPGTW